MARMRISVGLTVAAVAVCMAFFCTPPNPYANPERASGALRVTVVGGDSTVTVGDTVRAECTFDLGYLIDSAVVSIWGDTSLAPDTAVTIRALPEDGVVVEVKYVPSLPGTLKAELAIFRQGGTQASYVVLVPVASDQILSLVKQPDTSLTVAEGGAIRLAVSAVGYRPLAFAWYAGGRAGALSTDSVLVIAPAAASHAGAYRCVVIDGAGDSLWTDTIRVTVRGGVAPVNHAPLFVQSCPRSSYRIEPAGDLTVCVAAVDPDGDSVRLWIESTTVAGIGIGPVDSGANSWNVASIAEGTYEMVLAASDGRDTTRTTVSVAAGAANLPPVIAIAGRRCGDTVRVSEGAAITLGVAASDSDSGGTAALVIVSAPYDEPATGTGSFDGSSGVFTFTPSFALTTRSGGAVTLAAVFAAVDNGTPVGRDTCAFYLAVVDSNRAPLARDTAVSVLEDSSVAIVLRGSDPDDDSLAFSIVDSCSHGSLTGVAPMLVYHPAPDYAGRDTLLFAASDGAATSVPARVLITVGGDNDPPSTGDTSVATDEDRGVSVVLRLEDPDGDSAWCEIGTVPAHGTARIEGAVLTYTPADDYHGTDTVGVRPFDGVGYGTERAVTIAIASVEDAPETGDTLVVTDQDKPLTFVVPGSDRDGDSVWCTLVRQPSNGTASVAGLRITYIPSAGFVGNDTIGFTVTDGALVSGQARTAVRVNNVAEAPSITLTSPIDGAQVATGTQVQLRVNVSDPDGDLTKVEYYRSGVLLATETAAPYSHNFNAVEGTGQQLWAVAYDSEGNSTMSSKAVINVLTPVSINSQPANTTVRQNAPLSLTVGASGSALRYQWYKGAAPIAGATGTTFTKPAAPSDRGQYHCLVSNEMGSLSSDTITVVLEYKLVVAAGANGTVTIPAGDSVWVAHGASQAIGVAPATGYRLDKWLTTASGVTFGSTSSDTTTVKLTSGGARVRATFLRKSYTLTVSSTPAGGGTTTGGGTISHGDPATITATPAFGYRFTSWTVTGTGVTLGAASDPTTTATLTGGDVTVTANFARGHEWKVVSTGLPGNCTALGARDTSVLFCGIAGDTLFGSSDGGRSFAPVVVSMFLGWAKDIRVIGSQVYYLAERFGSVYTVDGAQLTSYGGVYAVWSRLLTPYGIFYFSGETNGWSSSLYDGDVGLSLDGNYDCMHLPFYKQMCSSGTGVIFGAVHPDNYFEYPVAGVYRKTPGVSTPPCYGWTAVCGNPVWGDNEQVTSMCCSPGGDTLFVVVGDDLYVSTNASAAAITFERRNIQVGAVSRLLMVGGMQGWLITSGGAVYATRDGFATQPTAELFPSGNVFGATIDFIVASQDGASYYAVDADPGASVLYRF